MSYRGPITEHYVQHGTRYVPGFGDLPTRLGIATKTLECYVCEHCNHECRVLGLAGEPFYSPQCGNLIGIMATEGGGHA